MVRAETTAIRAVLSAKTVTRAVNNKAVDFVFNPRCLEFEDISTMLTSTGETHLHEAIQSDRE